MTRLMDDTQNDTPDTPQIKRTTSSEVTVTPPEEDPPSDKNSNSSPTPNS